MRLLDERGDEIEADLLRFYQVDILDFYRGTLSARRLALLVRQLPAESATVRALNGGQAPWSNTDHRIADLWSLWAKYVSGREQDHPVRAAAQAKAATEAKNAKVVELKAKFQNRKRTYGLE